MTRSCFGLYCCAFACKLTVCHHHVSEQDGLEDFSFHGDDVCGGADGSVQAS